MANLSKKFNFKNSQGQILSGKLELPATKLTTMAIFAHCFTCSKDILAATRISKQLSQLGVGVLRFDFTGIGNSEGDFSNTNFSSNVEDIKNAYKALSEEYITPQILIGHSLGGAAVLKLSTELDNIKAVVTIGAPSNTSHVSHLFKDDINEINSKGEANVNLAGREFKIKKQFIDDLKNQDLLTELGHSKKAYLIMHSPTDQTVSVDHAANIYKSLKHPKSFISLNNADHLVSNPNDAEYIAQIIKTWIKTYIEEPKKESKDFSGEVLVSQRAGHNFTQDIYTKDHHIVADEPKKLKGDNLGMNPYELLLSSLGACTSMTMKMYAQRKGYDLTDVDVELIHSKESQMDSDGLEVKVDHIVKKIMIKGNLSDEEKSKIYSIAEKCPVNRTLQSQILITSELL